MALSLLLKIAGSALLKKIAIASLEVAVERSDNKVDDAILAKVKGAFGEPEAK